MMPMAPTTAVITTLILQNYARLLGETMGEWVPRSDWDDEDIEHWKSLDHTFCTQYINGADVESWAEIPAYQRCHSMHCPQCGKSVSSQGHLNREGVCPTPEDRRKPWPNT
jgi:hypothetical protein